MKNIMHRYVFKSASIIFFPRQRKNLRAAAMFIVLIMALCLRCQGHDAALRRFSTVASASVFLSPSGEYRKLYGGMALMPELSVAFQASRNLILWASLGMCSDHGSIMGFDQKISFHRTLLGLGAGYQRWIGGRLRLRGELGLAAVFYNELAFDSSFEGTGIGPRVRICSEYVIGKSVFLSFNAGYCQASDKAESGRIELGGFQAGAGLGLML
jgi:hypothetical protein